MPKLHYKKHKKEKKEKKEKKRDRKRHEYKPPKLYEDEEGWLPPENSFKDEQSEWQERLFDAMMDDEGQDPFYSNYRATPQSMTDEEHRQYIVNGIYEKRNAGKINKEKEREKRRKEAEKKTRELEKEAERKRQAYLKQEEELRSRRAQEDYDLKWQQLEKLKVIKSRDIPWPITRRVFSMDSVLSFMLNGGSSEDIRKRVRQEQIKYHPDKFMTRVMSRFEGNEDDKERVLAHMNEISGWLNEIWNSRS
ncbi:hypothetical protein G6F56_010883 [Rhizopus delemar]|uniref:Uncharacterized protein n=1 Tax=Rhizopus stolonifer TaxID=4846 RepID=A0A367JBV9_RHIST|nr:hypothetical protein G6F56_010883 [Rhizopus delemar]RCH87211.1 hypothetical protein CU098_004718 [Rhizopus stolonifer]